MTNKEIIRELAISVQKMMPRSGVGVLVITPHAIVTTPGGDTHITTPAEVVSVMMNGAGDRDDDGSVGMTD